MRKVRCVKSKSIIPFISEILNTGKGVRITVTGMSMYPFLRGNIDSVELVNTDYCHVKCGDILLVATDNSEYILHRVVRKNKKNFYTNGDGQMLWEGPFKAGQIVAKVSAVWRKERYISCSSPGFIILSCLWRRFYLFRSPIMKAYPLLKNSIIGPWIRRI